MNKDDCMLYAKKGCKHCYGRGYLDYEMGIPFIRRNGLIQSYWMVCSCVRKRRRLRSGIIDSYALPEKYPSGAKTQAPKLGQSSVTNNDESFQSATTVCHNMSQTRMSDSTPENSNTN